ncbi:MAG: thiamine pyrophosphate-binding protein [SAR324 cluster bacterium]|nr:thiamine pyrophosphate-binding protein [SAR324 cluster bacterium]
MTITSGRSAFLQILEQEGVRYLFGNPGTTELPIMDQLVEHPGLQYVLGLQESVVVTMAEGYARASGRLAAANVHVAPGLGNAMGALYGAKRAGVPLLLTAGQQEQGLAVTEPLLHDDLVPMAAPMVKWATEVTRVEDLPRVLHRAAKVALTPAMGPVFVSLPGDVLNAEAELDLGRPTRVETAVRPNDGVLQDLAQRLLDASAPLILAGSEITLSNAFAELAAVADLLGAPVYVQSVPHSAVFPSHHPLFMGELTRDQRRIRDLLEPMDLLFAAGADVFTLSVPSPVEPLPPGLPVVQLGMRDWELGKNYPAELAVQADCKVTLRALMRVIEEKRTPDQAQAAAKRAEEIRGDNWATRRARRLEKLKAADQVTPIDPDFLMSAIADTIPANAVVVDEGITSSRTLLSYLKVADPHRFFGLCGGGIGWSLPGAIGVKLALPERPVIAVSGDGSAMYNIQALWTAARLNLPLTYVICNNGSYRILKERLFAYGGRAVARENFIGLDLEDPAIAFTALAESLGVTARRVEAPDEVRPALREALEANKPILLDIPLQRGFRP